MAVRVVCCLQFSKRNKERQAARGLLCFGGSGKLCAGFAVSWRPGGHRSSRLVFIASFAPPRFWVLLAAGLFACGWSLPFFAGRPRLMAAQIHRRNAAPPAILVDVRPVAAAPSCLVQWFRVWSRAFGCGRWPRFGISLVRVWVSARLRVRWWVGCPRGLLSAVFKAKQGTAGCAGIAVFWRIGKTLRGVCCVLTVNPARDVIDS